MPNNTEKILNSFNTFFEENENYSRKELLEFSKKVYDDNCKKTKKVVDENAEKKPLNAYQLFMKEQRVILNKRENERTDGEKKKSTELMKEIAEMWKNQKIRIEKKEMFKEDNKPNKKELNISNDDEDQEAKIISNKKELYSNNEIYEEDKNKDESNSYDENVLSKIKKNKWNNL
jgi:hypothetical protein